MKEEKIKNIGLGIRKRAVNFSCQADVSTCVQLFDKPKVDSPIIDIKPDPKPKTIHLTPAKLNKSNLEIDMVDPYFTCTTRRSRDFSRNRTEKTNESTQTVSTIFNCQKCEDFEIACVRKLDAQSHMFDATKQENRTLVSKVAALEGNTVNLNRSLVEKSKLIEIRNRELLNKTQVIRSLVEIKKIAQESADLHHEETNSVELAKRDTKISRLETESENHQVLFMEYQKSEMKHQQKTEILTNEIDAKSRKISKSNTQILSFKKELESAKTDITELKAAHSSLIATKDTELQSKTAEIKKLQGELRRLRKAADTNENYVKLCEEEVTKKLSLQNSQSEAAWKILSDKNVIKLNAEIKMVNMNVIRLESANEILKSANKSLISENTEKSEFILKMNSDIKKVDSLESEVKNEILKGSSTTTFLSQIEGI